ncbi:MAG: hypothetical protein ACKVZ0_04425 [Gemmatimonadales bacterium]
MVIETRVLGKKGRPLDNWSVPPPPSSRGDGGLTLRQLIADVVRAEIKAFEGRQRGNRLLRVLSAAEIADGTARGKIVSGGSSLSDVVDEEQAVGVAIQAFQDGLYLVVLDGVEQRDLERQVYPKADTRLVFLRLTFLAGA